MNPDIIGEAWQAMSVLSDAQELLEQPERCNDHINHAKRHLIRAFELAREEDADAFRKAIMLIDCTLPDGEEHATTPGAVFLASLLTEHLLSANRDLLDALGFLEERLPNLDERAMIQGAILHSLDSLALLAEQLEVTGFRHPDTP